MKIILLACASFAFLTLTSCGDSRPTPTRAEQVDAHHAAAAAAEKSFDKEVPADPTQLK